MCHTTRIARHHTTHRPATPPPSSSSPGRCVRVSARASLVRSGRRCLLLPFVAPERARADRAALALLRANAYSRLLLSCRPPCFCASAGCCARGQDSLVSASEREAARGAPEVSRLRPDPIRACCTWPPHVASRFPNPITSFSRASAQLDSLLACHDDGARTLGPGDVRRGSGSRRYADGRRGGRLGIGDAASHVLLFGQRWHSIHRH